VILTGNLDEDPKWLEFLVKRGSNVVEWLLRYTCSPVPISGHEWHSPRARQWNISFIKIEQQPQFWTSTTKLL